MTIAIEPMTAADVPAALAIDLASFPAAEPDHAAVRERRFHEELARAWGRLRVARVDGAIAGYILYWHVTDEIHLLEVAVAPERRRSGVGRALVDELLDYARAHAAAKVFLEVRASNAPAIALYERLGFVRFNVRRAYYADGEDGIEMLRDLA